VGLPIWGRLPGDEAQGWSRGTPTAAEEKGGSRAPPPGDGAEGKLAGELAQYRADEHRRSQVARRSREGRAATGWKGNWGFFTDYMLIGLDLGYAAPYPCSPLDPPVCTSIVCYHYHARHFVLLHVLPILFLNNTVSCSINNNV
jgi:hypothetical protein